MRFHQGSGLAIIRGSISDELRTNLKSAKWKHALDAANCFKMMDEVRARKRKGLPEADDLENQDASQTKTLAKGARR